MPRKKIAKSTRMKMVTPYKKMSSAERMEIDFRKVLEKISAQYHKDLVSLKKQEKKYRAELKKASVYNKATQKKHRVLTAKVKAKNATAIMKKQYIVSQKACERATKQVAAFATQLDQLKVHQKMLAEKRDTFIMLCKQLTQREMAPLTVKKPTLVKRKLKRQKKPTMTTPTTPINQENITTQEMPTEIEFAS